MDVLTRLRSYKKPGDWAPLGKTFDNNDIVRNPIISKILNNYETVSNDVE